MSSMDWNGSRWWKFDFHTHTPASEDYGRGLQQAELKQRSPREWLLDYMRAEIDCVAVTDHNSGAWVDDLKQAIADLEAEQPEDFRPLHLFPGVEISVNGGIHVLAILGSDKTTSDIDSLLGAVGYPADSKGGSDGVTSKSFTEVVAEISQVGGIAIPAHVDGANGLWGLHGTTLAQALECNSLFAIEVVDTASTKPQAYLNKKLCWTEVLGSDSHHPSGNAGQRYPGSHFTWVKMGSPSLEGLHLALLDGPLSILRSDEVTGDQNQHAPLILESIEVSNAEYMGRGQPFCVALNPWLNVIIGGRGTGKSSLVEFLRLALRRDGELPNELIPEFEKYGRICTGHGDGGLLTDDAEIRVVYRKNGSRFRIQWSPAGDLDAIEEETDGVWHRAEGDVAQRFPIRMYSQKQIFHLAKAPLALLGVVDEAPKVDRRSWNNRWKEEEGRFLSLRAKAREIEVGLSEEPGLRGELDDVKRKLAIYEQAGHADVLRAFQKRRRQHRAVETWEESWADTGEQLREIAKELVPGSIDETALGNESEEDVELHEVAEAARGRLQAVRKSLENLAAQADEAFSEWQKARDGSEWKKIVDAAVKAYGFLREQLAEEGAGDPSAYGELVQRRQTIEQRLKELDDRRKEIDSLREQAVEKLKTLLEIRRELTKSRQSFLQEVLEDNQFVSIAVDPYGAKETVEAEFRQLIQREGGGFERDIGAPGKGGLLGNLYGGGSGMEDIENSLATLKQQVREIAAGSHDPSGLGDQRFANHIGRLQPEALDRLDLWFPEDSLAVQYSPTGDGRNLRSIEEGSPGQKSAALLAFLLSYGEEPLVVDQPEDDLDNHLIYELIVTQLREVKRHRQLIVVTHNPNIVVNGDAELVVALTVRGGQTQKESEGSLQEISVRNTICEVMEGGRDAFEERYRRILLEATHV